MTMFLSLKDRSQSASSKVFEKRDLDENTVDHALSASTRGPGTVFFFQDPTANSVSSHPLMNLISLNIPYSDLYLGSICSYLAAQPYWKTNVDLSGESTILYSDLTLAWSRVVSKSTMTSVVGN